MKLGGGKRGDFRRNPDPFSLRTKDLGSRGFPKLFSIGSALADT